MKVVALFQYSSRPTLDEGMRGIVESLAAEGFVEGKTVLFERYNAENDLPTANTIAGKIAGSDYDMVITATTPCLQAMASANRDSRITHVFAIVTDPFGAGVGINRDKPSEHPSHLAGVGSFQPVAEVFRYAKQINPNMKKVGVVWNPAKACSEACTILARKTCKELDMELIEAHVENSANVLEAATSLVSRDADALWIGGDNTVILATSSVVKAAREGRIPVFTNSPNAAKEGALLNLGAIYGSPTANVTDFHFALTS